MGVYGITKISAALVNNSLGGEMNVLLLILCNYQFIFITCNVFILFNVCISKIMKCTRE